MGRPETIILYFLLGLFFLCGCAQVAATPAFQSLEGKEEWRFVLHPPRGASSAAPLLVVLHGFAGDAQSMGRLWSWQPGLADVFVLAPQAPRKVRAGSVVSTWQGGVDDGFLLTLLEKVIEENPVDERRVAVAGYSSGAGMAFRLATKYPDRFSACVVVGGGQSRGAGKISKGAQFFLLAGERDRGFNKKKVRHIAARLEKAGASVQFEIIPGADHAALYNKIGPAARWLSEFFESTGKSGD